MVNKRLAAIIETVNALEIAHASLTPDEVEELDALGYDVSVRSISTSKNGARRCRIAIPDDAARIADRIDGYDRDDLGESPDY